MACRPAGAIHESPEQSRILYKANGDTPTVGGDGLAYRLGRYSKVSTGDPHLGAPKADRHENCSREM